VAETINEYEPATSGMKLTYTVSDESAAAVATDIAAAGVVPAPPAARSPAVDEAEPMYTVPAVGAVVRLVAAVLAPITAAGKLPEALVEIQNLTFPETCVPDELAELRTEVAVCPPLRLGADVIFAATTIVSLAAMAAAVLIVTGTVTVSPTRAVGIVPTAIDEIVLPVPAAAVAGTADNPPNPSATTATSAMRLKVVFVDILFLSVSREWEFPSLGLKLIS